MWISSSLLHWKAMRALCTDIHGRASCWTSASCGYREAGAGKDEYRVAAIAGGFIDVRDSIIIYTDAVEWSEDIDMERVLSEKAKAEDWLTHHEKDADPNDVTKAKIAISKAITRSHVAEGGYRRGH